MDNRTALKEWRKAAGLTQEQAAALIRANTGRPFKQGMWSEWEREGGRAPKLRYALMLEEITAGRVPAKGWLEPVQRTGTEG